MRTLRSLLAAILILTGFALSAQFSVGAKAGLSFNDVKVGGLGDGINSLPEGYTGYTLGVFGEYGLSENVSVASELNFLSKGFTLQEGTDINVLGLNIPVGAKARTELNYVEIPLLMKYKIGNDQIRGYAELGPSLSIATGGRVQPIATLLLDFNLPDIPINFSDDNYNRVEWGANVGAGIELAAGNGYITTGIRYTPSMSSALSDNLLSASVKNSGVRLSVGYAMSL